MADKDTQSAVLRVSVVTPRGPVTEQDTDGVTAPGRLGELEVLPGHVPLLTELHPGVLVLGDKRAKSIYAVSTGFLEVEPDGTVQVLVEQAVAAGDVDLDAAKAQLAELAPKLKEWKGAVDGEFRTLKQRHDWAQAQVDAQTRRQ
ncbi:MAG TPA: ATP synthase F1 subunit epsilon [Kofleriaceae bacterium]|nr:ATP synthase F1 subunit epsilon [Kofleriaceae bacterium]